jgi:beta-glucosidase
VADLPRPVIPAPVDPNSSAPFNVDCTIEGLNVGYKWYDSQNLPVLFPFGYGLSYTNFSISNLALTGTALAFQVSFDVQNTGGRAGAEVAQVYLGFPAGMGEPPKRLVGWQKVSLSPNQTEHASIAVSATDASHPMSYWDVGSSSWLTAPGTYTVYVGNSSQKLDVAGTVTVTASHAGVTRSAALRSGPAARP